VSAAETHVKSSANQDSVTNASKSMRLTEPAITDATHDAVNFDDSWERDAEELVSWTASLNV